MQNSDLRIRVVVADGVAMSCQLLADALQRSKRFYAVAAATRQELYQLLGSDQFDVVLISASFAPESPESLSFVRQIQKLDPELSIVVLVDALERNTVIEAFRCGACGVFCRTDSFQALCKCILCVHEGQVWASSADLQFVLEALVEPAPIDNHGIPGSRPLSKREEEIARLVTEGFSNRQISERLDLSEHTIKNYLFRVFEKLGVSTRVELTLYALKRGQRPRSKLQSIRPVLEPEVELLTSENSGLSN